MVGVLDEGEVVEPYPVGGDAVPGDEEAAEEEEVGEDGDHDGVAEHDVGDDPGEEGDEGAAGPKGGGDDEEEEEEAVEAARQADRVVGYGGEGEGEEDDGGDGGEGVGEDVGRAAVGVVGCFSHEDVPVYVKPLTTNKVNSIKEISLTIEYKCKTRFLNLTIMWPTVYSW